MLLFNLILLINILWHYFCSNSLTFRIHFIKLITIHFLTKLKNKKWLIFNFTKMCDILIVTKVFPKVAKALLRIKTFLNAPET